MNLAHRLTVLFGFVTMFVLMGCEPTPEATRLANQTSLKSGGFLVGTLPDGREVRGYRVNNPADPHIHWVYVVGNDVTVNRTQRQGKVNINVVEAALGLTKP